MREKRWLVKWRLQQFQRGRIGTWVKILAAGTKKRQWSWDLIFRQRSQALDMGRPREGTDWGMTMSSTWVLLARDACVQVKVLRLAQDRSLWIMSMEVAREGMELLKAKTVTSEENSGNTRGFMEDQGRKWSDWKKGNREGSSQWTREGVFKRPRG